MGNLIDYIAWRDESGQAGEGLTPVDLAALSRAAYLPLSGVVPESMGESVPLPLAMERALPAIGGEDDRRLAQALAKSRFFSGCALTGCQDFHLSGREEQFAALSLLMPDGSAVAAFRGTDDSLVGWKEDLNMTFSDHVASQLDARQYVHWLSDYAGGPISLCGHSKGGNLAMYAAVFCRADVRERIRLACNFDGPGFDRAVTESPAYRAMVSRMHTYLPQSSIVGMLLEHEEDFTIVESEKTGIRQHNLYRWRIEDGDFRTVSRRTNSSFFMDDTLKSWVGSLEREKREKTINAVYQLLTAAQGKTFRDLTDMRSLMAVLRAAGDLDEEQRHALMEAGRMLRRSMKSAFPALLDRMLGGRADPGSQDPTRPGP